MSSPTSWTSRWTSEPFPATTKTKCVAISTRPSATPLWDVLGRVVGGHYPGARLLPRMIVGFTDAPYFRARGAVAYGFGLFSRALTAKAMAGRFHGNDERVDVASLALTTQAWLDTCEQFLG